MKKIFKVLLIAFILLNSHISKITQITRQKDQQSSQIADNESNFLSEITLNKKTETDMKITKHENSQLTDIVLSKDIDSHLNVHETTRLLAVEESIYDKNRKTIINDRATSDSEKEYRIFQNTLLDILGGEIDLGSNNKLNLVLELKDEYIEVRSKGDGKSSFKYGIIYFKNYIAKCISPASKVINRKKEFLRSIVYPVTNQNEPNQNGLPDNIRLAFLSKLNSLVKDDNFIQHLYRISPKQAQDIKSDVDLFAEQVASIVEDSFCYTEFSKSITITQGCKQSSMSGALHQGGELVVEDAYLNINDTKANKVYHIKIADKLQSSNSSDIKKAYVTNLIEKLDQSDVPQNYKDEIFAKIKNDMYDILTLSSENIEGKNIIEKIIEIAPKLILKIATSFAIAAALGLVSSFLLYLYRGYQIAKSTIKTLNDFIKNHGFLNTVLSVVNLYLNVYAIKQLAEDFSSLGNKLNYVNENTKDCANLSNAIYQNDFPSKAESLGFKVLAVSGPEEAKNGVKAAILEKNGLKYIVSEGTNFSAAEGVAQLKADGLIFLGKRPVDVQNCFENWARINMNKLGITKFDYATGHSLGGSHVITFSAETNLVQNTITFDSPQVLKSTTMNAQTVGKNIINFRASLVGYQKIDRDALEITNYAVQVNSLPRLLVAAIKEHSKGGIQVAWNLLEELNKHKMQDIAQVLPKILIYLE